MHYSGDIELASRVGRIVEPLVSGHPNEHSLRAAFTQMSCTVKACVEPLQAIVDHIQKGHNSAAIVGDTDNSMLISLLYVVAYIYSMPDLKGLQKNMRYFMHQTVRAIERHRTSFSAWKRL